MTKCGALAAGLLMLVALESVAHAQTEPAQLVRGTWRLVSWTERLVDGSTRPNAQTVGYLIYTDAGRMCAMFMDPNRPKWNEPRAPTGTEALSAISGMTSYCGTYEINPRDGFIIHHVEIETRPNLVGLARRRLFSFEGNDRLILRVDPSETPGIVSATLVWERVQPVR